MKTMNMPGFTADDSLYKTSRRYRTGRNMINLSEHVTGPIYPAMINLGSIDCGNCVGGECAELHCFEDWTHGGGGGGVDPRGPYRGGGGRDFGGGSHSGCIDSGGRIRSHGTTRSTRVVLPGGGVENTYYLRQKCIDGDWIDFGH